MLLGITHGHRSIDCSTLLKTHQWLKPFMSWTRSHYEVRGNPKFFAGGCAASPQLQTVVVFGGRGRLRKE